MASWYVRRGEKVIGPVDAARLKQTAAEGKLLPTDELAKDPAGPWTAAAKTSLFAPTNPPRPGNAPAKPPARPPAVRPPSPAENTQRQLAARQQPNPHALRDPDPDPQPPTTDPQPPRQPAYVAIPLQVATLAVASTRTILVTAGGYLSKRSDRKHQLKLAEIEARAKAGPGHAHPPAGHAPVTQTTVVKITNRNGGCGCSGCAGVLLLIILIIILAAIFGLNASP